MNLLKRKPMLAAWLITTLMMVAAVVVTGVHLSFWQGMVVFCALQLAVLILLKVGGR